MSRVLLDDASGRALPGLERALAGLAALLAETPWLLAPDDGDRLRAAGFSDAAIVHAVGQSVYFNYLNRVADAVGIEFDYESPLPRAAVNAAREATPRPPRAEWPRPGILGMELAALRPQTAEALARWREYALAPRGPLDGPAKRACAAAAAGALCDAATVDELAAAPRDARDEALAGYAAKLTATPWRMGPADLDALRAHGLDDRALLDAIATVSIQNGLSRARLCLS